MVFTREWYQHNSHPRGFLGKKHSVVAKAIFSSTHKGKKKSDQTKSKMALSKIGSKNPHWAGDKVTRVGVHYWAHRNIPGKGICNHCHLAKKTDVANISGEYKREISDWEWLCRKCHMISDGRLKEFLSNRIGGQN